MGSSIQSISASYYQNLLVWQYKGCPQFNAWLAAVLSIANDISLCLQSMEAAFDLNYAIGNQLDILGQIIGVSRTVNFQPSGGVSPVLDDTTYRILLLATLANNTWDGTIGSLYPIWQTLFPGGKITIVDNQDMSATILIGGSFSSIMKDLITHDYIVPRPQAVEYTYSFAIPPFFGFDREDAFIGGLGTKWG
jgi:hypothetical protein